MQFLTKLAILAAAGSFQLARAAPSPSPSEPAQTEGLDISLRLPAGYSGTLQIHAKEFLEYASKNSLQLPWVVTTVLEAAPDPVVQIKAGDGTCDAPIQLPENSGLDGKVCAPDGQFDPKALGTGQGDVQRRACSGSCYGSCVDRLFDGTYDTCLTNCITGNCGAY